MGIIKPSEKDEFKILRFFAVSSFVSIIIIAIIVLLMVWFGGDGIDARINSSSGILIVIVTALIGNFAHYGHVSNSNKTGSKNDSSD